MTQPSVEGQLSVRPAEPKDFAAWDTALTQWPASTLFHRMSFLQYHPVGRFDARPLVFEREEKIVGLLPMFLRKEPDGSLVGASPFGASYGGFAFDPNNADAWFPEALTLLKSKLVARGAKAFECTLPPHFYGANAALQETFLLQRGARPVRLELSQFLDLTPAVETLWSETAVRCRQAVRKARKTGLRVESPGDIKIAWEIIAENKRLHDNAKPTHTLDELLDLSGRLPDDVFADVAYDGENPVAAVLYFRTSPRVWCTFYIADLPAHRRNSPASLLVWHGIERAREKGARWIDFGTSSVNMELRDGVAFFKKSFGATYATRPTWRWDF